MSWGRASGVLDTKWGLATASIGVVLLHMAVVAFAPVPSLTADAVVYDSLGRSLVEGKGYELNGAPQVDFMPGYPAFLALVYWIAGRNLGAVRVVQAGLAGLVSPLVFVVARKWFGRRAAAYSFISVGGLPALLIYPLTLNAEILVVAGVAMVLWVIAQLDNVQRIAMWGTGFGFVCGVLAIVKPEFSAWLPLPVILLCLRKAPLREIMIVFVSAVFGFSLILLPWIVRNAVVFERFIPFSTSSGRGLWLSAHKPTLTEIETPEMQAALVRCSVRGDPKAKDACLRAEAIEMIGAHPIYYAQGSVRRVIHTLFGSHTEYLGSYSVSFAEAWNRGLSAVLATKVALLLVHSVFAVMGLVGLVRLSLNPRWWFLSYLVITKLVVHAFVFGTPRYGLHLAPVLALTGGALFLGWSTDEERAKRQ